MKKQEKFEKVVEYKYPNGEKYEDSAMDFYLEVFVMCFIYVLFSPIHFFYSDFCGKREVYWRKKK